MKELDSFSRRTSIVAVGVAITQSSILNCRADDLIASQLSENQAYTTISLDDGLHRNARLFSLQTG